MNNGALPSNMRSSFEPAISIHGISESNNNLSSMYNGSNIMRGKNKRKRLNATTAIFSSQTVTSN